ARCRTSPPARRSGRPPPSRPTPGMALQSFCSQQRCSPNSESFRSPRFQAAIRRTSKIMSIRGSFSCRTSRGFWLPCNRFILYPFAAMKDNTAPATKADIAMLKTDVKQLLDAVRNLYDANERWKDEIVQHFNVVVEDIRHDLAGANRD